jgi:DNA polymerase-3 subunit epsilon
MRQVVLDTETTGLEVEKGHRIIELGCVELVNRRRSQRHFHVYINPEREIDEGAREVHGISSQMLADKPRFSEVLDEFMEFVDGAELIIHNADFDVGFVNRELSLAGRELRIEDHCRVLDTLSLARQLHPGQRNSLDALCKRYEVDNAARELHGALLDAQLLAEVYLAMTGGQGSLSLDAGGSRRPGVERRLEPLDRDGLELVIATAGEDELSAHREYLEMLDRECPDGAVWRRLDA